MLNKVNTAAKRVSTTRLYHKKKPDLEAGLQPGVDAPVGEGDEKERSEAVNYLSLKRIPPKR